MKKTKNVSSENMHPFLSLDFGKKLCGLSWSPDGVCVLPISVFHTSEIEKNIQKIVTAKKIEEVVIGLPISSDGSENQLCKQIRTFAKRLQPFAKVEFINERFSSQLVTIPDKLVGHHGGERESRTDDLAAVGILELFLKHLQLPKKSDLS